ncbi:MAG: hypothetical protein COB53_08815 [Elusimicrobia bacterium]|nr:MAG: hypothetical protein COB53_08815 [Elusimicrobiota bacterium]
MTDVAAQFQSSSVPKRLLVTAGLLTATRLGHVIPVPGSESLTLFSGGITPYLLAAVLVSLLRPFLSSLSAHFEAGASGREKLDSITRYVTAVFAVLLVVDFSAPLNLASAHTVLTVAAGSMLLLFIAEEITESGLGSGVAWLVLIDIARGFPGVFSQLFGLLNDEKIGMMVALIPIAAVFLILALVVAIETAQRKITVMYSARVVGRQMMAGQKNAIPVKVNSAGIIGALAVLPIFFFFPAGNFATVILATLLIGFFTWYYSGSTGDPNEIAKTIQNSGGYIPGIRPGEGIASHFSDISDKISLGGAAGFALITLIWESIRVGLDLPGPLAAPFLIIAAGTIMELLNQGQGRMMLEQGDGHMMRAAAKAREGVQSKRRGNQRKKKKRRR